jgi:predicted nicotinamide N-methyase
VSGDIQHFLVLFTDTHTLTHHSKTMMKSIDCRRRRKVSVVLTLVVVALGPHSLCQSINALSASFNNDKDGFAIKESTSKTRQKPHNTPSTISLVDLGLDKHVKMFVPSDSRQRQQHSQQQMARIVERGTRMSTRDGGGDVIWPSGIALSKLIAHCPSIVDHRNVMELGCGLGLVSIAAAKYSRPSHVALCDKNKSVLSSAYASCTQLQRSRASISRCVMDWSDSTTWPAQNYDVLLAADVLYEKSSVLPLVKVLRHYLLATPESSDGTMKRAIIVDPANQVNRDAFCYAAFKAGLDVDQEVFPGSPDLVLMNVSPL